MSAAARASDSDQLIARVLAPDGSRVPDAIFLLYCVEDRGDRAVDISADLVSNGEYRILPTKHEGKEGGPWPAGSKMRLDVTCERYGKVSAEIESTQRFVEVQYSEQRTPAEAATLMVRLVDYNPASVDPRITIGLLPSNEDPKTHRGWIEAGVPDQGPDLGKVVFSHLDCREYTLFVLELMATIGTQSVSVHPGENGVTVSMHALLSSLFTMTVFVPDGREGDGLVLFLGQNRTGRGGKLDANLRATFDRLPASDYVFAHLPASKVGGGYGRIHVEASGEATFCPEPMNSLKVTLFNSDGVLARAGFVDGDVITSINDEPFNDYPSLFHAYNSRDESDAGLRYTIQRGRTTKEIYLGRQSAQDSPHWGGLIQPFLR
jgi:hypothetical protein